MVGLQIMLGNQQGMKQLISKGHPAGEKILINLFSYFLFIIC